MIDSDLLNLVVAYVYYIVTGISVCSLTAVYVARLKSQTRRRLSFLDKYERRVRPHRRQLHTTPTPAVSKNQLYSSPSDYP